MGLCGFAELLTSLCVQKPTAPLLTRILPQHVFQLQCFVDSFTIAKGWYIGQENKHVLCEPALDFKSDRDLLDFLVKEPTGLTTCQERLQSACNSIVRSSAEVKGAYSCIALAKTMSTAAAMGLIEGLWIQPRTSAISQFSKGSTNGLWRYSPSLCGTGTLTALTMAGKGGDVLFGSVPDVKLAVHLHNMLVCTGYLKDEPTCQWTWLAKTISPFFFKAKNPPSDGFYDVLVSALDPGFCVSFPNALHKIVSQVNPESGRQTRAYVNSRVHGRRKPDRGRRREKAWRKDPFPYKDHFPPGYAQALVGPNIVNALELANWDPYRIPDDQLPPWTFLGCLQFCKSQDPEAGEFTREGAKLARKYRQAGLSLEDAKAHLPFDLPDQKPSCDEEDPSLFQVMNLMNDRWSDYARLFGCIKFDIGRYITGDIPFYSISHATVASEAMELFGRIEHDLAEMRHPVYVEAYETNFPMPRYKLACLALRDQNDECLKVMAKHFELSRSTFTSCRYWDDSNMDPECEILREEKPPELQCSIM